MVHPQNAHVGAAAGAAPTDISQMTPIEAADRLFNRVMTSVSSGDSLAAQQFMPMAIAAYQRARPLTLDGLFHLSMLNRTAGNFEAALDNAVEILEIFPSENGSGREEYQMHSTIMTQLEGEAEAFLAGR